MIRSTAPTRHREEQEHEEIHPRHRRRSSALDRRTRTGTPALAAPSGSGNASQTISQLEAQGHRVVVKKQSSTPLSEANVVSVRQGPPVREYVSTPGRQGNNRNKTDRVLQEVGKVYFVEVR